MRNLILLNTLIVMFLTGCVNDALIKSYTAYQNTIGVEYKQYLKTGKKPTGKNFSKAELRARHLNLKAAEAVLREIKKKNEM